MKFFGFAIGDSMFPDNCLITKKALDTKALSDHLSDPNLQSCCNPSHKATIDVMEKKFGLTVAIPETPPRIALSSGDSIIIMGVRGLPRMTDRHEYSAEEIANAVFSFSIYTVS